jgi:hypothetical protein
MSPQLTTQQLLHAIANLEKRVAAKKLEAHSLAKLRDFAPDLVADLTMKGVLLHDPIENLCTAKLNQALIDLEEFELALKAYKQMSTGIVGATSLPPSNSKMH